MVFELSLALIGVDEHIRFTTFLYREISRAKFRNSLAIFFRGEGPLLLAQEVSHSLTHSLSQ